MDIYDDQSPVRIVFRCDDSVRAEYNVTLAVLHFREETEGRLNVEYVNVPHRPEELGLEHMHLNFQRFADDMSRPRVLADVLFRPDIHVIQAQLPDRGRWRPLIGQWVDQRSGGHLATSQSSAESVQPAALRASLGCRQYGRRIMGDPMSKKYLFLQRSQPGSRQQPSPAHMQDMYAAFNAWKEKFKDNILDMGGKLMPGGKVVSTSGPTDGPFVEAKEIVGGYMFVSADSVEKAIEVAREMPMLMPGSSIEIREVAGP